MTYKSLTLDNLENHWQPVRSAILATTGILFFTNDSFLVYMKICL